LTGSKRPRLFYGYIIVIAAFLIQMIGWGVVQTFGVFLNPLLDDFGWSRAMVSGAVSVNFILYGFFGVYSGRLGDRFGPRLVMTVCGIFLGLGCLVMSQIGEVWQLYLAYGVLVAMGTSGVDVVLLATVARWFKKKRGAMSGLAKVGAGASMFLMPIVVRWLISSYGWRNAYIFLGSFVLIFLVLVAQLLSRDPSRKGLLPDGVRDEGALVTEVSEAGLTLVEAMRTRQFWMFCGVSFCIFFCAHTLTVHIVAHAIALGVVAMTSAGVLSTVGAVSIAGRLLMGNVGDRIGNRKGLLIGFTVMAAGIFWLQGADTAPGLYLYALLYGFAHGAFFALISPMVADLFGLKAQGTILGIVIFVGTFGGAAGAFLAGKVFDLSGTYLQAFLICALLAVAAFVILLLIKPVRKA